MRKLIRDDETNEKGSAMLITTIILLVLMVIVATAISISGMQFDLAMLNRNTSNTYYLAKSAVEKQVDTMNKAVETELTKIVNTINKDYINKLISNDAAIEYNGTQINVNKTIIKSTLETQIYEYLKKSYETRTGANPSGPDPIKYTVQSDRLVDDYYTEIEITIATTDAVGNGIPSPALRVIATATTKSSGGTAYDEQTVEGIVEVKLPDTIENQIHERYALASTPPEVLNSAILCFSDVFVSDVGSLKVTAGDVRVSGKQIISGYTSGGTTKYPEADQNGGVIAINGGKIDITNNLYCTNNVLATNGWVLKNPTDTKPTYDGITQIKVGGDIIAYTVGIVDDYYEGGSNQSPFNVNNQVQNATITVGRNIMVDNDVMIDRWVNGCDINVTKTIFGINAGVDLSPGNDVATQNANMIDPNQSSGVFSQGESSTINAERMYVAGQPYITLASNQKPLKLWESIGEPFNGVASFEGYATNQEKPENDEYLLTTSPFYDLIKDNKIETDFNNTYAFAGVSGLNATAVLGSPPFVNGIKYKGASCNSVFGADQVKAVQFFYQGLGASDLDELKYQFSAFMEDGDTTYATYTGKVQEIIKGLDNRYAANSISGYFRNISSNLPMYNYRGLRGYMTIMRSIFYTGFDGTTKSPLPARFADIIRVDKLPNTTTESNINSWSYQTPICVTKGGTINISNFYVDEGTGLDAYPTIIVSRGTDALTIEADSGKSTFNGIIISESPVIIEKDIVINGTVIIGGPESVPDSTTNADRKPIFEGTYAGLIIKDGTVTIKYDAAVLEKVLNMSVKDHVTYRKILDGLYFTNYADYTSDTVLTPIMQKQSLNTSEVLKYTDKSILEVDTEGIEVAIKSLKKTQ